MKKLIIYFLMIMMAAGLAGCTRPAEQEELHTLRIAYQYGTAYAPLDLIKTRKTIEAQLPGITVEWQSMGNTATIREAMAAGQIDIGFMAIPPFLIGYDKGMNWKLFTGLSSVPTALVSKREDIHSLADFKASDQIALPQPGSIQHILLSMACKRQFADAKRLDAQLLTMSHPDAANMMLSSNELAGHFTTPPYLQKELAQSGMKVILDGEEAFGEPFTFIVGAASKDFYTKYPRELKKLRDIINSAAEELAADKEKTAGELAVLYEISPSDMLSYLSLEGVDYSIDIKGLEAFAAFMKEEGYIQKSLPAKELMVEMN